MLSLNAVNLSTTKSNRSTLKPNFRGRASLQTSTEIAPAKLGKRLPFNKVQVTDRTEEIYLPITAGSISTIGKRLTKKTKELLRGNFTNTTEGQITTYKNWRKVKEETRTPDSRTITTFNPKTGYKIKEKFQTPDSCTVITFNSKTGERNSQIITNFDPTTGNKIKERTKEADFDVTTTFDPKTGHKIKERWRTPDFHQTIIFDPKTGKVTEEKMRSLRARTIITHDSETGKIREVTHDYRHNIVVTDTFNPKTGKASMTYHNKDSGEFLSEDLGVLPGLAPNSPPKSSEEELKEIEEGIKNLQQELGRRIEAQKAQQEAEMVKLTNDIGDLEKTFGLGSDPLASSPQNDGEKVGRPELATRLDALEKILDDADAEFGPYHKPAAAPKRILN